MLSIMDACFSCAYCPVVVQNEVQLSSTKCEVTCEVFMSRLVVWDCNLIVKVGVVNLKIPVERS